MSGEKMVQLTDDNHLAIGCHLERAKWIAWMLDHEDSDNSLSESCGLAKFVIQVLANTIVEQLDQAEKLLDSTGGAS